MHNRWIGKACVEDIRREFDLLVRKADKESSLNVELGLKNLGVLRDQAHSKPIHRRVGQLRPSVVEVP